MTNPSSPIPPGLGHPSRRTLLASLSLAPLATLAACASVPNQSPAPTPTLGPSPSSSPRRTPDGQAVRGALRSAATGGTHEWVIYYPPGASQSAKLPVVIALHGWGDNISILDGMNYPVHLAAAVAGGVPQFALAAINGGKLFWQKAGRKDAGALVAKEFLTLLRDRGLDTDRLGLTGWSMGGWGTLRLACDELRGRLRAAAALSTPCYPSFDLVAGNNWMTRAAFETNNFYHRTERLTGLPIYLACGREDGFFAGNKSFAKLLRQTPGVPPPVVNFGPGDHSPSYWEALAPTVFGFIGKRL